MASTITAATMTLTIQENITINGQQQGGTTQHTIASINEVTKRIVSCPASNTTTVASFSTNVYDSAGAIDVQDCKYVRITNLDNTNPVEVAFVGETTLYQVNLKAGESHILGSVDDFMLAEADTSPSFGTMGDIKSIQANPASNIVDLEIFTASV